MVSLPALVHLWLLRWSLELVFDMDTIWNELDQNCCTQSTLVGYSRGTVLTSGSARATRGTRIQPTAKAYAGVLIPASIRSAGFEECERLHKILEPWKRSWIHVGTQDVYKNNRRTIMGKVIQRNRGHIHWIPLIICRFCLVVPTNPKGSCEMTGALVCNSLQIRIASEQSIAASCTTSFPSKLSFLDIGKRWTCLCHFKAKGAEQYSIVSCQRTAFEDTRGWDDRPESK